MSKAKNNTTVLPPASPRYVRWIEEVRELQRQGLNIWVALWKKICEGRDANIWREGPYQSFERCLHHDLGVHPQRWAHLDAAIRRFGESWVATYGIEAATTFLRVPKNSEQEQFVFRAVEEMREARGGQPPSPESVKTVVDKVVPKPQRPVGRLTTESDRLRAEVRDLTERLHVAQKELAQERRLRARAEAQLAALQDKMAKKARGARGTRGTHEAHAGA